MQTVLVTSGEPAGIGPDICLDIPNNVFNSNYNIVVLGDSKLLINRARMLNKTVNIRVINELNVIPQINTLNVLDISCPSQVVPGKLNQANSSYVIDMLNRAVNICKNQQSNIIVTAPINKQIINNVLVNFTGHTEYFANQFGVNKVVMMLANSHMKVALLTTHLPIKDVAKNITSDNLNQVLKIIINSLQQYGIKSPKVAVCGLNPHSGEGGYIGDEEIKIINPVIKQWQEMGFLVSGSHSADTVFLNAKQYDLILAMYHDQGLPVLKYSGFEDGINITLGLPIIRTSVDHGTALDLAGSGLASSRSLMQAVDYAIWCNENKCRL